MLKQWIAVVLSIALPAIASAAEPGDFLTGAEFIRQLNRPLLANRDYSPFRTVLTRLSEDRNLSVVLDRRIDPERLILVDVQANYFDSGIEKLAADLPASVVVFADAVFVTTPETARTLRTRILLAERQLESLSKSGLQRQLELSRKQPLQWESLTSPRELLVAFADRNNVKIQNPEEIPYDLWAGGCLPHVNFTSGALFIVAQYERDLNWIDADTVRLVPQGADPQIEQEHVFRGRTRDQVATQLKMEFPDLTVQMSRDRFRMTGRVEEHEAVDTLLGNRAARKPSASVVSTSLANRRFTLRMMNRPFLELVGVLEKQGIQFGKNLDQLTAAGVDLNQRITLELENATIETLLTDACSPLGLAFQIDGTRIELGLAPRPVPDE